MLHSDRQLALSKRRLPCLSSQGGVDADEDQPSLLSCPRPTTDSEGDTEQVSLTQNGPDSETLFFLNVDRMPNFS